jgi:hypothetical protein
MQPRKKFQTLPMASVKLITMQFKIMVEKFPN